MSIFILDNNSAFNFILFLSKEIFIVGCFFFLVPTVNLIRFLLVLYFLVTFLLTFVILNLGFFLSAGFDQVFNLMNTTTISKLDIIDTYVYRVGLLQGNFSLSIAAGLFKGLIGFIMIMSTHFIAKKISGRDLW